MIPFANIDTSNVVTGVIVIADQELPRAQEFITQDLKLPGLWVQCDPNAYRNHARDGSNTPVFRKNYPEPGYGYQPVGDYFFEPKPADHPDWVLNTDGGYWQPPVNP
jgi:hypothetical protein